MVGTTGNVDDMEKLDIEMEEEELVFERQDSFHDVELGDEYWPLRIKSIRDIQIQVRPSDTVGKIKETVLTALGEPVTRYLRLVCKGRLLAPDQAPLKSLKVVQPDDVIHAVLAGGKSKGVQAALQQGSGLSRRALRSAGINASGLAVRRTAAEQEEDDDEEDFVVSQGADNQARRGFDRLRILGLRRAEISALRAYFSRHVDRFVAQQEPDPDRQLPQDPMLRRLLQEEAWMQSQGPLSEFRLNLPMAGGLAFINLIGNSNNHAPGDSDQSNDNPWLRPNNGIEREALLWREAANAGAASPVARTANPNFGNDRDFMCGFLLGFFVGFIMLVWVWMPTVPHKQKLGILTGITVQLALGMLRPQPPPDDPINDSNNGMSIASLNGYAKLLQSTGNSVEDLSDDGIVLG